MRAVTRPLAAPVDLDDVAGAHGYLFVRNDVGLAGRGIAARVPCEHAGRLLGAIETDDGVGMPGCGPVAVGVMPFQPDSPAELIVPRVVVGKSADGTAWTTVVGAGEAELADALRGAAPRPAGAAEFAIASCLPPEHYMEAVAAGRDAVRRKELTKLVLARQVNVRSSAPFDVHAVLGRLRAAFGRSYRYSVDGLIGASPELLVEVRGREVRSYPLAGTAPRTGDPDHDARSAQRLIASVKDQVEHRVVVDVVHDTLLPYCSYLDEEPEPGVVTVANVQHLGTLLEGVLAEPHPGAADLARLLSPTPALGGHPRDVALALLCRLEGFERGRYGGAVGWLDARGNGTWAVAIRGAELSADRCEARLTAGCGIVGDSDPSSELVETQAKFQAMLSALVRP